MSAACGTGFGVGHGGCFYGGGAFLAGECACARKAQEVPVVIRAGWAAKGGGGGERAYDDAALGAQEQLGTGFGDVGVIVHAARGAAFCVGIASAFYDGFAFFAQVHFHGNLRVSDGSSLSRI